MSESNETPKQYAWEPHDGPRPDLPPWHPLNVAQPGDTQAQIIEKMNEMRGANPLRRR